MFLYTAAAMLVAKGDETHQESAYNHDDTIIMTGIETECTMQRGYRRETAAVLLIIAASYSDLLKPQF